MTQGIVRIWHQEEGWGIIDSPETPDGCWAHYSHLKMQGFRALEAAQTVSFSYEKLEEFTQDGFVFRALEVIALPNRDS